MIMESSETKSGKLNVLVISDNKQIAQITQDIIESLNNFNDITFEFYCSAGSDLEHIEVNGRKYMTIDVKRQMDEIIKKDYLLVLSAHCRQIFPKRLVDNVRCINIHPGYNPYNRGMYPHVFSILNGLPTGATLHEMTSEVDGGPIIDQQIVEISLSDTSESLYNKIIALEETILVKNMRNILLGTYETREVVERGNLNTKKDFELLREVKLSDKDTFENHLNRLRALSHGDRKNLYFIDPDNGKKIWIKLNLEEDQ
jgi:methionyl-tRNA formyltransferase